MDRTTGNYHARALSPRKAVIGFLLIGLVSIGAVVLMQRTGSTASPDTQRLRTIEEAASSVTLTLPTIDGGTVSLPGDTGEITVLYTMGYWCGSCVPGAQTLARLQPEYAPRGVRFIAVDVTTNVTAPDLTPFLQAVGQNQLTWAMDSTGQFVRAYQINSLDTAIILDRDGREVYRNFQSSSDTEIRAALDRVLAS
jgi:thiol-disulfide isomerase/thioredoxin